MDAGEEKPAVVEEPSNEEKPEKSSRKVREKKPAAVTAALVTEGKRERKQVVAFKPEIKDKAEFVIKPVRASCPLSWPVNISVFGSDSFCIPFAGQGRQAGGHPKQ